MFLKKSTKKKVDQYDEFREKYLKLEKEFDEYIKEHALDYDFLNNLAKFILLIKNSVEENTASKSTISIVNDVIAFIQENVTEGRLERAKSDVYYLELILNLKDDKEEDNGRS